MDSSELDLPGKSILPPDSLFERCHWLYALFREYLFRDHTEEIKQALFPAGEPPAGTHVVELGCGPGFYSCRLAKHYPQIRTTGIDLSKPLIEWARSRARNQQLENVWFCQGDAQDLPNLAHEVDSVIVSRLFLIVPNKEAVLSEIFRVLKPGGRCYIEEPASGFTTRLPLIALWLLARLTSRPPAKYREPQQQDGMSHGEFTKLASSQPWSSVTVDHDNWYQYALCIKPEEQPSQASDQVFVETSRSAA
jgi:arsenite methyltransferase